MKRIILVSSGVQIKDILVQQRLLKVLQGKKLENMKDEDWEELKARVLSIIHLSLAIK